MSEADNEQFEFYGHNNNVNHHHHHHHQQQNNTYYNGNNTNGATQATVDERTNLNKLLCSFKSELPNEIDFAMQIATLMANTVCDTGTDDLSYTKFWLNILGSQASNEYLRAAACPPNVDPSFIPFDNLITKETDNNPNVYRRIKGACELIRQFSMTANQKSTSNKETQEYVQNDYNQYYYKPQTQKKKRPKVSKHLLKLVSLLIHCQDIALNSIGLDILSNLASKLCKVPHRDADPICAKLVEMFQDFSIHSITKPDGDIYIINRSIEILSRILASSSIRVSSSIKPLIIEKDIVSRVEQFLTSHYEVTLFLSALEFCYIISRHQPTLLAGRTKYLVKILVKLLDCDDYRYFTADALKKIKILVRRSDEEENGLTNGDGVETSNGMRFYPNQSPLSVSVRLTAALILRNLAAQSAEVKQALTNYEPFLSEICMTNGRDESKIIAECLSLLNDESTRSQGEEAK